MGTDTKATLPGVTARLTVAGAAAISHRHPVTLRNALQEKTLHGVQRVKRGTWLIEPACLDAWIDGKPCPHAAAAAAVTDLGAYRTARTSA